MSGSYTTAMPTSMKLELATAIHDFTITTGGAFYMALGIPSPTGTYGASTTNYSGLTGNSDEVASGSGYTTGGVALTNITPQTGSGHAYWQFGSNPSWTSASFSSAGCLAYNSSKSNKAVYVGSLGGTQTVTSGTLTLVQPTNGSTTALFQLV